MPFTYLVAYWAALNIQQKNGKGQLPEKGQI